MLQKTPDILWIRKTDGESGLNLLESFAGTQNTSKIPLQDLDSHRFKRADLFGKLVNIFADLDSRDLESSSYFKCISGGDLLDAERKHKDPFYFRPFARLVYSANEIPRSPDRSFAFYRRWSIIPFPRIFVDNADRTLIDKLTEPGELSGLLNRALSGLKRLFSQGHFTESTTVRKALAAYKRENDPIDAFVSDRCDFSDPKAKTERVNMYAAFSRYCKGEGYNRLSRKQFYKRIRALPGVASEVKGDQGKSYFVGIKLKPSQPRP